MECEICNELHFLLFELQTHKQNAEIYQKIGNLAGATVEHKRWDRTHERIAQILPHNLPQPEKEA